MARERQDLVDYTLNELIDIVSNSPDPYKEYLRIPTNKKGYVFLGLSHNLQVKFSQIMKPSRVSKILKYMDQVDVVDFLELFDEDKKKEVLSHFNEVQKKKIEYLLQFDPESAAGLMDTNFILVHRNNFHFDEIRKKIEWHIRRNNKPPLVIVKEAEKILGYIPITKFILSQPKEIDDLIKELPVVDHDEEYLEIIDDVLEDNDFIAVVDEDKALLGYIELDTLIRIADKKNQEEVFKFAGVSKEEDIFDSIFSKIKSRYLWLILNLFTAFLAAAVIGFYEDTLSKLVLLAVYLPIIAGMGGNAATQTLAVVIRGIAVHEIDRSKRFRIIFNEVMAGLFNGIINGILIGLIAYLFNGMYLLGVAVFLSMIVNLVVAGFFGTIVPFILKRFKIDPATAATVFVTTATDLFGFFVFLALAELIVL